MLHPKILLFLISFFIFGSIFFSSPANPLGNLGAIADISINELLTFTNQKRQENGLPSLSSNSQLEAAAMKKAEDMFAKNYWAHNAPDGTTPWFFIKEAGYNYVYAGENLARGFNSANDVVNAWMASPSHRANLLSKNYKDVGFAVKSGTLNGENTFLVVQEFGSKSYAVAKSPAKPKTVKKKVLGFEAPNLMNKIPTFSVSTDIVFIVMMIIIGVFIADMLYIRRRSHIVRFVGHNLDHAIFLLAIIIVIGIFNTGVVL
jgi:hypothetical protein